MILLTGCPIPFRLDFLRERANCISKKMGTDIISRINLNSMELPLRSLVLIFSVSIIPMAPVGVAKVMGKLSV
ncbi:hypothetical protein D3C79_1100540 [compost metagenome]